MGLTRGLSQKLGEAVKQFWATRQKQDRTQGSQKGTRDAGERTAVTGGAQMDGFVALLTELLEENGLPREHVFHKRLTVELPGWYRPEKQWDLLVIKDTKLLAGVEMKSHVGPSFGNNYNNRTEEAIGSATDLWAAYREGAFKPSIRPWLGYLMLLEEAQASTRPVKTREPHFEVFPEFRDASYAKRYEILLTKLIRERLYDASCLLLSDPQTGPKGEYREPSAELSFENFSSSLLARAIASTKAGT